MSRPTFLTLAALAALLPTAAALAAQQPDVPADTFADPAARELLGRARSARGAMLVGLESYEGLLREHMYVGLTALSFRRERALFEQERVARLRWEADGERAIQWLGARRAIPVVGADTRRDRVAADGRIGGAGRNMRDDLREDLPRELLEDAELPNFAFDPAGERLTFGNDWALHPLADTALAHYRYASGDTLRLSLPDRRIVLYEIRVEPRRADFHLVAGSLWFDSESAELVRASYRPARAFDLSLDEPEDAEDVPGFLRPVEAEISYITVEYGLYELRYWLPRRFAMEGEARLGSLVRIPLTVEWRVRGLEVNEETSDIPATGTLPPGWARRQERVEEEDGSVRYVTVVVPPDDELMDSPELSEDFGQRSPTAFTDREVDELKEELEALLPTYHRYRPRLAWGLERGLLRYNRVEGLSAGVATTVPLTPLTSLDAEARMGTGHWEPYGHLALVHGPDDRQWRVEGYHRLRSMSDWDNPFGLTNSLGALFFGTDKGQYFQATGGGVSYRRLGSRVRVEVGAFAEAQRGVSLGTDFFLLEPIRDDTLDTVLTAEDLELAGVRGQVRWFSGLDPNGFIAAGTVRLEAAGGDASYRRLEAATSLSHPLPLGLAGALAVGAGATWGQEPLQREFFLGGPASLRGFDMNELHGPSFWRATAELATGFAGARIGLFADAGWAGPRADFAFDDPAVAVGVGTSLLDGIFRADLARAVRGESRWKVHLYLDGLF